MLVQWSQRGITDNYICEYELLSKHYFSCEFGCQFDQNKIDFTCTCQENMELSDDLTSCQAKRLSSINAYEVTNRSKFGNHAEDHEPGK